MYDLFAEFIKFPFASSNEQRAVKNFRNLDSEDAVIAVNFPVFV